MTNISNVAVFLMCLTETCKSMSEELWEKVTGISSFRSCDDEQSNNLMFMENRYKLMYNITKSGVSDDLICSRISIMDSVKALASAVRDSFFILISSTFYILEDCCLSFGW
ncbi:MAG: hypothetical protein GY714_24735 [Desulfobacterales bacterium]|nr:hypothetical protein [Desulfobacterales bacterium]